MPEDVATTAPATLLERAPSPYDADAAFENFSEWADSRGLRLYPAQEEALIEIVSGANLILSTPTGTGKSLVAIGAHFAALAQGKRSYYTAPIKALVSEKFFALVDIFGAENVGMVTGDSSVNPDAPIICCTAEILANVALRGGADSDVDQVVMDEFHFYADPDRGWAWQVPLLTLPRVQFILMSATLGDVSRIADDLTVRTGRETAVVTGVERPVPLSYSYATTPVHETIEDLLGTGQAPIYIVHFSQLAALERAQAMTSIKVVTREQRDEIAEAIGDFRFTTVFGQTLSRLIRSGIGVHHAGMLPKYRRLVEQLAQQGLMRVICGTDTLGVGINVPIRTVLFTALTKYDGIRTRQLTAREFHQIAGRAGRAGYDTAGTVVAQAPEHESENARLVAKAGDDPKKIKKIVRKKAPDGFVSWGEPSFNRLISAEPEVLTSSMQVSHSMILNVIAREGDAFQEMRDLIFGSHDPWHKQLAMARQALAIYRTLRTADVVTQVARVEPAATSPALTSALVGVDGFDSGEYEDWDDEPKAADIHYDIRLTVDLQPNFALNQPLSPFALAVFELLDPESPSYALDMISILESTLDDPRPILSQQQFLARGEAVASMKAEGIEYDQRMELLEQVTWPKPLEELLDASFEQYSATQPWIGDFELSPKSVVRDMYERAMTFADYVGYYKLARSEGLVLRYLSDAYRAVRQTVPDEAKTEELLDLIEWLGELVRQVDSSLVDEWEQLINPTAPGAAPVLPPAPPSILGNPRAFRVLVRNELFRRVQLAALDKYEELGELDAASGFTADAWGDAMDAYWDVHDALGTDADARSSAMLIVDEGATQWTVRQIFADPSGDHDWGISATVDLEESAELGVAVVKVTAVGRLDAFAPVVE
ncbi:superfamily II RNA helicase [Conyzicola lurida]|uniref:Superfamily II RNA helicase n=1 Tax=Conyzicola lurida TaxID=1172621 RepID=A0A841ANZ1_9MICO|nr:DEAD/DEAH box helicase [Conyzicola lurida]MBB5843461.1 superfamily II RNA helicase [Conyzicola lurida]